MALIRGSQSAYDGIVAARGRKESTVTTRKITNEKTRMNLKILFSEITLLEDQLLNNIIFHTPSATLLFHQ